jgi:hypothetical protein
MAKKTTDAEIQLRVNAIYDLIIEGNTFSEILQYCEAEYNIHSNKSSKRNN